MSDSYTYKYLQPSCCLNDIISNSDKTLIMSCQLLIHTVMHRFYFLFTIYYVPNQPVSKIGQITDFLNIKCLLMTYF